MYRKRLVCTTYAMCQSTLSLREGPGKEKPLIAVMSGFWLKTNSFLTGLTGFLHPANLVNPVNPVKKEELNLRRYGLVFFARNSVPESAHAIENIFEGQIDRRNQNQC